LKDRQEELEQLDLKRKNIKGISSRFLMLDDFFIFIRFYNKYELFLI